MKAQLEAAYEKKVRSMIGRTICFYCKNQATLSTNAKSYNSGTDMTMRLKLRINHSRDVADKECM